MKQVVGMVVSNKMQKSVVVAVDRLFHHKLYNRYVKRTSKFMAHDEQNQCNIGDRVCLLHIYIYIYMYMYISLYIEVILGFIFEISGEIGPFKASKQA